MLDDTRHLFILGYTGSGKSTLAKRITAQRKSWQHISAGGWVSAQYPTDAQHPQERAKLLTEYSLKRLKEYPHACIDYINAHHDLRAHAIIEGVRNPSDFVHLFNPRMDRVIHLHYTNNPLIPTEFERQGLHVIDSYLQWLIAMGVCEPSRYQHVIFDDFQQNGNGISLEEALEGML